MQDSKIRVNAPKDPQKLRSFFYVMTDTVVCGNDFGDGVINDRIFLDNQVLVKKAEDFGGITDERILGLLSSSEGFRKLVHSIGITLESDQEEQVVFELRMYGRKDRFESGTRLRIACNCDGTEQILSIKDYKVTEEDDVPGFFEFGFNKAGQTAKASIRFYLNDGYTAPVVDIDPPVDFKSEGYRKMIEKSLLHMGNVKRIQDAVQRAERGEEITIAYIGGSITEGAGAKPSNKECYAYKSFSAFKGLCGESRKVNYIKAGVGGTPSEFGMVRYERDVLKENKVNPDIVVVEFAVNDADDETEGNCFESLVCRILSAPNHPAVVLLFSVFVNDWNLQDRLAPIGFKYDLLMVSVKDAVVEQFSKERGQGNVITKRQFFYDIYHPTNDGHIIMADCLTNLFKKALQEKPSDVDIDLQQPPVIGRDFVNIRLVDRTHLLAGMVIEEGSFADSDQDLQKADYDADPTFVPIFPNNWMHRAVNGNEPLHISVKCKSFVLVYKDSGAEEFGKACVHVDGNAVRILNPRDIGWTHCHATILVKEEIEDWHDISIRMEAEDEGKRFTVLGFGIVNE